MLCVEGAGWDGDCPFEEGNSGCLVVLVADFGGAVFAENIYTAGGKLDKRQYFPGEQ